MKIDGKNLIIESTSEAVDVWARPQCIDKIGGGSYSVLYAVYDYLGIDIQTQDGYQLIGATNGISKFYEKLCKNSREYADEQYSFSMVDGDHTYPDDSDILKVLVAYQQTPAKFTLDHIETDHDLQIVITNTKNDRQFSVSVAGSPEEHVAYFVLLSEFTQQIFEIKSEESKNTVLVFLSDD